MEKDPEIEVISALLSVLTSQAFKSCSLDAQNRVYEWFSSRFVTESAPNSKKPALSKQPFKVDDLGKHVIGLPPSTLTVTDLEGEWNLSMNYPSKS